MKIIKSYLKLAVCVTLLLFSCQKEQKTEKEEVETILEIPAFSTKVITEKLGQCANYPEERCLDINIEYPIVDNKFEELNTSIQDFVREYTSDFLVTEKLISESDLYTQLSKSAKELKKEIEASNEIYEPVFQLDVSFKPMYSNSNLTTIVNKYISFKGGAHPNSGLGYSIFNNDSGELMSENIILKDEEMKRLVLNKIKQSQNGTNDKDLEDLGFLISDREFAVGNNIGVKKDSLFITYSPYEIAPYSMGYFNINFSKQEIENLLQPSFVEKWTGE